MLMRIAGIVILAACSTLRAQKSGVEGVPSLARAFLVAGVPAVIEQATPGRRHAARRVGPTGRGPR